MINWFSFYRTKHVSFARSHTLTSFEDLSVDRSVSRLSTTKSQERLIGGKKSRSSSEHLQHHQLHHGHQFNQEKLKGQDCTPLTNVSKLKSDSELIEKLKRNVKKTQATQTDVFASRQLSFSSNLSMSPRSAHRVCINGNLVGRKLTKSLSEAITRRVHDEPSINM